MIKDILVNLVPGDAADRVTNYAIAMATALRANVTGVAFRVQPDIAGGEYTFLPNDAIRTAAQEHDKAAKAAAQRFTDNARAVGLMGDCHTPAMTFIEATERLVQLGRCNDVIVLRQPRPEAAAAERLLIEAVLFNSGRPVLVVPYIHDGKANLERITVCWDGSKAAARAVADSLPLLAQAKHVDLLTITEKWTPGTVFEASDMAIHLTRHNVRLNVVEQPRGEIDIGNTILNFAADNGVDLLVMGGYGHPRLGEAIFGGATLTMLQSMTVPTLMSH